VNRVLTDHLAARLYCPAPFAARQLAAEGITRGVSVVGDVMDEALALVPERPAAWLGTLGLQAGGYHLATVHRQENTDEGERLAAIVAALGAIPGPVVWPMHPRTRERLDQAGSHLPAGIRVVEPVGYPESLALIRHARAVVTDSGGVQREAGLLGVPCYILRTETEWLDLLEGGHAVLVPEPGDLAAAIASGRAGAPARPAATGVAAAIVSDLIQAS
jgi:UDP-N-acetylglucosamine 2-epimerase